MKLMIKEDYNNSNKTIAKFLEILKNKEIIDFEVITDGYEYKIVDLR